MTQAVSGLPTWFQLSLAAVLNVRLLALPDWVMPEIVQVAGRMSPTSTPTAGA